MKITVLQVELAEGFETAIFDFIKDVITGLIRPQDNHPSIQEQVQRHKKKGKHE